jgi:hypothetical protein
MADLGRAKFASTVLDTKIIWSRNFVYKLWRDMPDLLAVPVDFVPFSANPQISVSR